MSQSMPYRPDLEWYQKGAKKKLKAMRLKKSSAKLAEAQHAIAREFGFANWRGLVAGIAKIRATAAPVAATPSVAFAEAAKAIVQRDRETAARVIRNMPEVARETGPHPNWGGMPQLLHVAIEVGEDELARLLLDAGADPSGNNATYDGWSPLMLAVRWKRNALRDLLVKRGAKIGLVEALMLGDDARAMPLMTAAAVKLPVPNDGTPLHFARTAKAAERLLELNAAMDARDKYGRTALDTAAAAGASEVVDLLIAHGADAFAKTFARLGDLARLKKFLGKKKPEATLLTPAILSGSAALVKWLLARGVDVNAPDEKGTTPLHTAAFEGNMLIVKLLVQGGANVHAEEEEYGATPAGWAQHAAQNMNRQGCAAVAGYLKGREEKKWSVKNMPEHRKGHKVAGWKPLMDAAFDGDAARIVKLIKAGADANVVSSTSGAHRPLHRAMEEKKAMPRGPKHEAAVKALLKGGADPFLRGGYDRLTALQLAALDTPRFVPILLKLFMPLDFCHACAVLDLPRVEALLKEDAQYAARADGNGFTPLHYVAGSRLYLQTAKLAANQLRMARLLMEAGADVNGMYVWPGPGQWPIPVLYMCCGRNDNAAMTELLMQAGAQPFDNESVYHAADEGHAACLAVIEKYADAKQLAEECTKALRTQMHWGKSRGAAWLLEHGADVNSLHPQFGNSALHQAAKLGANDKVIRRFLEHGGDPLVKNVEGKTAIELAKGGKAGRVAKRLREGAK